MSKPEETEIETQHALEQAVGQVRSETQADRVLNELERNAGDRTEGEVARGKRGCAHPSEPAAQVIQATARRIATESPEKEAGIDSAIEKAMGASAEAEEEETPPATARGRSLLRKQLLERLKPIDKVDASVYLMINNLPHPRLADRLVYGLTSAMTGGNGWALILGLLAIRRKKYAMRAAMKILPAIWLSSGIVEYPIKKYFRRRRPFISIMRAIVVGRKPGNFSFPSGHTAAAFAGSALLSCYFPKGRGLFHTLASATGLSRIYVGAHYPGDVISGAVVGTILAKAIHGVLCRMWK